jgi:hypothetical protein
MLLAKLHAGDQLKWCRAVRGRRSLRAVGSGETSWSHSSRSSAVRQSTAWAHGRPGMPSAALVPGAQRHEVPQLRPLLEAIPAVRGQRGHPRHRPHWGQGDRGSASAPHQQELRARGITPGVAKRGTAHRRGLGLSRWVVGVMASHHGCRNPGAKTDTLKLDGIRGRTSDGRATTADGCLPGEDVTGSVGPFRAPPSRCPTRLSGSS